MSDEPAFSDAGLSVVTPPCVRLTDKPLKHNAEGGVRSCTVMCRVYKAVLPQPSDAVKVT